uniref:C2H2-type domain-containing protein n=1 Tax=Nothobranchius kuhntae TaxID=321403 RepID=A0A1A8I8A2_NOTKU
MSAGVMNLQAQVESVLGSLVKAASVELIKLFESRYRASVVEVGLTGGEEDNKSWESLDDVSCGDGKRSIGVQVEKDIRLPLDYDPPFLQDVGYRREQNEEVVEACLLSPKIPLAVETGCNGAPLKIIAADNLAELSVLQAEVDNAAETEDVLEGTDPETSTQRSPVKPKLIVIQPVTSSSSSEENMKFVCPLILKSESPVPKLDHSEPQQSVVSTAKGTAYSPSPSDGAVTPAQAGVWERIHTPKQTENHLQLKLKFTCVDKKLLQPCGVQLVDVLRIPRSEVKSEAATAKPPRSFQPLTKDVRRHQGPHTGHRLCCFTRCGGGIWRLRKIVTHSREGYVCSICAKAFKRRKILRRHERFHTGEKPYSCSVCAKTFALRKSLRRHVRFHTDERPYCCSQCGKPFRLRDNLKAHLRFHSGEKPFSCAECGKMFRIMRNLEKHRLSRCETLAPLFRKIAGL